MKTIFIAMFAMLLAPCGSHAQDPSPHQSTVESQLKRDVNLFHSHATEADPALDDYIRIALDTNLGLRAAFDTWQAALQEIPQARALPDPTFQWTHFIEEIQTRTGPQNNRFILSQKIPWKGKRAEAANMAQDQSEAVWWQAVSLRTTIVRDLKQAYYEYADLAQNIRIVGENLSLLQNLEPVVQSRIRGGANQSDLLRLQVEIGKLENELQSLEKIRPALDVRLKALLNRDSGAVEPWPSTPRPTEITYRIEDLRTRLTSNNPDLKVIAQGISRARHNVIRQTLEKKPDFTVGLTYIDTGHAKGNLAPSDSGDDPFGFTVGISIPIWRNKLDAGVRQARYEESSGQHQLAQIRKNLLARLELHVYRLENAEREMALYQNTLIPRSRQTLELVQVGYESGKTSLFDLIDTEREMLGFEKSYWRAVNDYGQSAADIEALCGGDLS
ncbi:MAG: TolC family protein [Candidatus Hydrogenedentota bacterium]